MSLKTLNNLRYTTYILFLIPLVLVIGILALPIVVIMEGYNFFVRFVINKPEMCI